MSEVMRWKLKGFLPGVEGMCKAVMRPEVVLSSDYDAAQVELAALREELARLNRVKLALADQVQVHSDNCSVYRTRLTAAEQRNSELEKNAARYIWLRDKSESVHQFYLSTPIWFTGVKFNPENVDSTIDAVMAQPTESGANDKCVSDGGTCGLGGQCAECPHKESGASE